MRVYIEVKKPDRCYWQKYSLNPTEGFPYEEAIKIVDNLLFYYGLDGFNYRIVNTDGSCVACENCAADEFWT